MNVETTGAPNMHATMSSAADEPEPARARAAVEDAEERERNREQAEVDRRLDVVVQDAELRIARPVLVGGIAEAIGLRGSCARGAAGRRR